MVHRLEDIGAPDRSNQTGRTPFPMNEENTVKLQKLKGILFTLFDFVVFSLLVF